MLNEKNIAFDYVDALKWNYANFRLVPQSVRPVWILIMSRRVIPFRRARKIKFLD